MKVEQTHVFSAEKSKTLDSKLRRLLQDPFKILSPNISAGMTVLDYGCGTGYFSIPLSKIVGQSGKVYAVDIQKEMLEKLNIKLLKLNISNVVPVHNQNDKLNLTGLVDFAIAVYVVHEIPSQKDFFNEIFGLLKSGGKLFVIEPDFIVSRRKFEKTLSFAKQVGFIECEKLNLLLSKSKVLMKE